MASYVCDQTQALTFGGRHNLHSYKTMLICFLLPNNRVTARRAGTQHTHIWQWYTLVLLHYILYWLTFGIGTLFVLIHFWYWYTIVLIHFWYWYTFGIGTIWYCYTFGIGTLWHWHTVQLVHCRKCRGRR